MDKKAIISKILSFEKSKVKFEILYDKINCNLYLRSSKGEYITLEKDDIFSNTQRECLIKLKNSFPETIKEIVQNSRDLNIYDPGIRCGALVIPNKLGEEIKNLISKVSKERINKYREMGEKILSTEGMKLTFFFKRDGHDGGWVMSKESENLLKSFYMYKNDVFTFTQNKAVYNISLNNLFHYYFFDTKQYTVKAIDDNPQSDRYGAPTEVEIFLNKKNLRDLFYYIKVTEEFYYIKGTTKEKLSKLHEKLKYYQGKIENKYELYKNVFANRYENNRYIPNKYFILNEYSDDSFVRENTVKTEFDVYGDKIVINIVENEETLHKILDYLANKYPEKVEEERKEVLQEIKKIEKYLKTLERFKEIKEKTASEQTVKFKIYKKPISVDLDDIKDIKIDDKVVNDITNINKVSNSVGLVNKIIRGR